MAKGNLLGQVPGIQTINNKAPETNGNFTVNAKEAGALPISGGNVTGPMTVQNPTQPNNPATLQKAKDLVNGAWKTTSATLTVSGWGNGGNARSQKVRVPGLKWNSIVFASGDGNNITSITQYKESDVWAYRQENDYLYFWYYEDKPTSDFPVNIVFMAGA